MKKIGFVIDSIEAINPAKDTTLAMVTAAFDMGLEVFLLDAESMSFMSNNIINNNLNNKINIYTSGFKISDIKHSARFVLDYNLALDDVINFKNIDKINLFDFDYIIMRKDPPVDANYIYLTYFLEYLNNNKTKKNQSV